MDEANRMMPNVEQGDDEGRIETHCYACQQELPDGAPLISSKCGVYYHEDCAKRTVICPACGENLLDHFMSEEAKKKIVNRDRLYTMVIFMVPFIVVELLIGLWSMMNHPSKWSILPWFGEAFIVDLLILIIGIGVAMAIFAKFGYKPEKKTIHALVLAQKGPTPGKAEEQLYACGYGERLNPVLLGDISIPNKAGVQRENVIRVSVDRLSQTPDGTFVWLNPRFSKAMSAKDNPQPSNPEELEKVWKASGRTKIGGEGTDEETDEEKVCSTCGKPLEYITEYDAWYCTSCGKYEEEEGKETEGDLPPPDDSTPPPS